jgi:hypothetical protein
MHEAVEIHPFVARLHADAWTSVHYSSQEYPLYRHVDERRHHWMVKVLLPRFHPMINEFFSPRIPRIAQRDNT